MVLDLFSDIWLVMKVDFVNPVRVCIYQFTEQKDNIFRDAVPWKGDKS